MEGAHYVATGELLSFSVQQIIDCASPYTSGAEKCEGCLGGNFKGVFDYFHTSQNYLMLESEYPYTSGPKDAPTTDCLYSDSSATKVEI